MAVKVQLFADGDITVFISNPVGTYDEATYQFLEGAYKKVSQKIQSLAALRRDIQRIGSLLATGTASYISYQFNPEDFQSVAGLLGLGALYPELLMWGKKVYGWINSRKNEVQ